MSASAGVITDPDIVAVYNEDALGIRGGFEGVARPREEADVQALVADCAARRVAVTAQGLRSSLTGASMCPSGIALSLERMNRILDIDVAGRRAWVEPGVITADLRAAAAAAGLYYPPDPTSMRESTLGGNVATNAAGSCALKYGRTADWVRGVRLIDGRGVSLEFRDFRTEKHAAGAAVWNHPSRFITGSEGTLGVITRLELGLTAPPPDTLIVMAFFEDMASALAFVVAARRARELRPVSMEFLDEGCLAIVRPYAEGIAIPREAHILLYFELEYDGDGDREAQLELWFPVIETHSALAQDTQIAASPTQKAHLWELRHRVPQALNEESSRVVPDGGCKISTDWAVPYARLPELFEYFEKLRPRLGDMRVVRFAHVGEGHPHFNFIARNPLERAAAEAVDALMARKAVVLGGCITGEHGIGKLKREHMSFQYPPHLIQVMRALKNAFDPAGILAPGNILP